MDFRKRSFPRYIIAVVVMAWLATFSTGFIARLVLILDQIRMTRGMDDEQKRELIYGDFYRFLTSCKRQIPENATVFLVTNELSHYYYGSYYLYPRRILINSPDKAVDGLAANNPPVDVGEEFYRKNNISYVIVPGEQKIIKVK